jgi:hypothetical protein
MWTEIGGCNMPHSPTLLPARIRREKQTVAAMIAMYCHAHHATNGILCSQCEVLMEYAYCRLDHCPHGIKKRPCGQCPASCYKVSMRTQIREVMRYAGPRMILHHPILALLHQWDKLRGIKLTKGFV